MKPKKLTPEEIVKLCAMRITNLTNVQFESLCYILSLEVKESSSYDSAKDFVILYDNVAFNVSAPRKCNMISVNTNEEIGISVGGTKTFIDMFSILAMFSQEFSLTLYSPTKLEVYDTKEEWEAAFFQVQSLIFDK